MQERSYPRSPESPMENLEGSKNLFFCRMAGNVAGNGA
jgi:hypothetical protein